jgi:hypothetical protein
MRERTPDLKQSEASTGRGKGYTPDVRNDTVENQGPPLSARSSDEREYQVANWALARTGTFVYVYV